jgi:hypothetical protein
MRLLVLVMIMLLAILLLGFLMTNLHTRTEVTVWTTVYREVHIFWVVLGAVAVGVGFTAFLAIAEGASTRLDNRRLRREVHKLENEINYLRTQPRPTAPPEPDALDRREPRSLREPYARDERTDPASAPVYGMDDDEEPHRDADDDMYTGGRAV